MRDEIYIVRAGQLRKEFSHPEQADCFIRKLAEIWDARVTRRDAGDLVVYVTPDQAILCTLEVAEAEIRPAALDNDDYGKLPF